MTSSSEQPPKEPLIQRIKNAISDEWWTTEEIRKNGDLLDIEFSLFNNYLYQIVKSGYAERQSYVRCKPQRYRCSRPHPAPAPQMHTECYIDGYNDGSRKAREEFASKLIEYIDNNNVVVNDEENEDSDDMLFTGEVRALVESLRSITPQNEQEGRAR